VEPIVVAFGNALVAAMATDTWERARSAVAALWRRLRPSRHTEKIELELQDLREKVLAARHDDQPGTEQKLAVIWQAKLNDLVLDDPRLHDELQRILTETLAPMLTPAERTRIGQIAMTGTSYGNSTFNQVAGNQVNY
jgi:hypothetical protein